MALTKTDIIDAVPSKLCFSKNRSTDIVESLLEIIRQTLAGEEDVLISGFGIHSQVLS